MQAVSVAPSSNLVGSCWLVLAQAAGQARPARRVLTSVCADGLGVSCGTRA